MSIPALSVKRPIFITSLVLLLLFTGWQAMRGMPVNLFPQAELPFITISTLYPGAGPREVETSISKPLEDELATLEGMKKITATSQDSLSIVLVEFQAGLPLDTLEQRLRDRVARAKAEFPKDTEEPIIERMNASNDPILTVFIESDKMNRTELTDWADQDLKPLLSRVPKVGRVDILGGTKREIHVEIDPKKLGDYRIPLLSIAQSLESSGQNVPGGSLNLGDKEMGVRSLAQFEKLSDLEQKLVSFANLESGIRIKDMGRVVDTTEKERTKAFMNGKEGIVAQIYKQSGANTVSVTDAAKKEVQRLNEQFQASGGPKLTIARDGSQMIRDSIFDVWESIIIGILLTVVVVYFFLGSMRSTVITGFAIPNSLLGAFVFMSLFGFSLNILTLLALSLCVGLLVDDAIVVRENIFKQIEAGKEPKRAAIDGANEVAMAVVAVTAAVLSMFGPVAFLTGTVGQFFREFGLTICFAMLISLFDAMAVAPMLSAYWGGKAAHIHEKTKNPIRKLVQKFDHFQSWLERKYQALLNRALHFPVTTVTIVIAVAAGLTWAASHLPGSFLPVDQSSEFSVTVKMPSGTSIQATTEVAKKVEAEVRRAGSIETTVLTVGNTQQELNVARVFVKLKKKSERADKKPSEIRDQTRAALRENLKLPEGAEVLVVQADIGSAGVRPFSLLIQTSERDRLKPIAERVYAQMKELNSFISPTLEARPGGQEIQVELKSDQAQKLGVSPGTAGTEVRGRIEGLEVGKFRENGREYDIKLTTNDPSELWVERKREILVPNVNMVPVDLRQVADFKILESPAKIERVNRSYTVRITSDLGSEGLTKALSDVTKILEEEKKTSPDLKYMFEGDAESYDEMSASTGKALLFGIVFLFLVLASLYESFLLSFLNIVTLPLAVCGAFFALLIMQDSLHLYSMIGMLLLLGVATKNSILLVDTAKERLAQSDGKETLEEAKEGIASASVRRLRPILMTSLALIAGTIPIAVGLNEASAQRTGMGIAIVGGTISSTLFTLIFIPALLILVEKAKIWFRTKRLAPKVQKGGVL